MAAVTYRFWEIEGGRVQLEASLSAAVAAAVETVAAQIRLAAIAATL